MSTTTSPSGPALPLRSGPVRFMVLAADGKSSNSWRFWTEPAGDAYLACRDNFKEAKISLHTDLYTSQPWRIAWTQEAVAKNPALVDPGQDRAWEKWEPPPPVEPGMVAAVRMLFLTSELAVEPEQRITKVWRKNIVPIEAAPSGSGKLTVVTLFVTDGDKTPLRHRSEPSLHFASLELGDGQWAQLVAHFEPEGNLPDRVDSARRAALEQAPEGVDITVGGYVYLWGPQPDGARMLVGARMPPPEA